MTRTLGQLDGISASEVLPRVDGIAASRRLRGGIDLDASKAVTSIGPEGASVSRLLHSAATPEPIEARRPIDSILDFSERTAHEHS